jgi:hypothetical protein
MPDNSEPPMVMFRVRSGRQVFMCRGRLVWEGGIVIAVTEEVEDGVFMPDRVRLEESDLELQHDDENGDWYLYHGLIFVP